MLPALTEIVTNLVGFRLEPTTTAAVLDAVLTPLLRSSQAEDLLEKKPARTQRHLRPKRRKPKRRRVKANAEPTDAPRQRAIAVLKANPDATLTRIAKLANCSRSTAVNARDELAAEARKSARVAAKPAARPIPEPRQRAQRFLKEALAHGPRQVSDVEAAAAEAHVDEQALGQARADLGVVTSRSNAGGVQAVQWSLPG